MPPSPLAPGPGAAEVEQALDRDGVCAVRVLGTSMRPTLRSGDVVLLEPVEVRSLRFGDLVAVRTAGEGGARVVIHRLVRAARTGERPLLWLKGDGLGQIDPFGAASGDRLLGRVRAAWRGSVPVSGVCGIGARLWGVTSLLALPIQVLRGH